MNAMDGEADMQAWTKALEQVYAEIAATRMAGLPVMHPRLQVRTIGFAARSEGWWGVLLTPWFMNLVWRDLPGANAAPVLAMGASRDRAMADQQLCFTGAWEDRLGAFETCSLMSPMFQFADQAAAEATAHAVLAQLIQPISPPQPARAVSAAAGDTVAARRRFLFGSGGAA